MGTALAILLGILKVIGWVLLGILLIILAILLIVLLVPVRYRAHVVKKEELSAEASVTWLLKLLQVKVLYEKKLSLKILLFGIPLPEKKKEEETEEETTEEKKEEKPKKPGKKKKIDPQKALKFAASKEMNRAIRQVFSQVGWALKTILPKRPTGEILFGMESPADTGIIYGALCALYPDPKLVIETDFNRSVLECDVQMKGKIVPGAFLLAALRIALYKDVLYLIRHYREIYKKEE